MNAHQRRILHRVIICNLTSAGIVPGVTVERKAPGKKMATQANVELITFPWGNPMRPILQVRRSDNRSTEWALHDVTINGHRIGCRIDRAPLRHVAA